MESRRFDERHELCPLTDSMGSAIRWRLEDYGSMLRTELAMLAAATEARPRRRDSRPSNH